LITAGIIACVAVSLIVAVITAAIAAMIESGDYGNEFAGGFRVVSFKRSTKGAWNRK
jgi:hypothetical protein